GRLPRGQGNLKAVRLLQPSCLCRWLRLQQVWLSVLETRSCRLGAGLEGQLDWRGERGACVCPRNGRGVLERECSLLHLTLDSLSLVSRRPDWFANRPSLQCRQGSGHQLRSVRSQGSRTVRRAREHALSRNGPDTAQSRRLRVLGQGAAGIQPVNV